MFPQVIVNVKVREKRPLEGIPTVAAAIRTAEAVLDSGRVVIRYSGTEALARVMIEAESEPLTRHHADTIAAAIRRLNWALNSVSGTIRAGSLIGSGKRGKQGVCI